MEEAEATQFLESLLGKTFNVTVLDGRLFSGTFQCTDSDSNIILSNSFEYRMPSRAAEKAAIDKLKTTGQPSRVDMTSRFVGLIVIPGKQIAKMEVEEKREWPGSQSLSIRTRP
ncbi:LSM domain-containing protein 1 [Fonsecaea pedrosoi]|nr:LSM domain-containing protein 1 [Fonsecaea pedrosoi]